MTVRTFTDQNGETRLVATIAPEPTFTGGTLSGPTSNAGVLQVHTTSATPGDYGFLITDHNGSLLFGSTVIGFTTEVLVFGAISGGMNIWANLPADNYP